MPARRRSAPAARPDSRAASTGARPDRSGREPGASPWPCLLGCDQVPVERLAAVPHLDVDRRQDRPDPPGHALGLGEVRAVAVEDRDQLEPGLQRRRPRPARTSRGRCSPPRGRRPGSSAIVWPRLTLRPPIVASRTASVTTRDWIARPASVIGPALPAASSCGSSARSAANPSAALRVGTTCTGPIGHGRHLARGQDDVRVVGQDDDSRGP